MITKLQANFLQGNIENDVILVGFADDEFNPQEYILLQKFIGQDEQNKKLGFDKVHITYSDQSRSAYGGIRKFVLKEDTVNISLDARTADALKTETQIEVVLPPNVHNLTNLKQHLQKLFSDEPETFVSGV